MTDCDDPLVVRFDLVHGYDLEEKGIQEHPKTDGVRFLSETLMGGFHKMGDQEVTKRVSIY